MNGPSFSILRTSMFLQVFGSVGHRTSLPQIPMDVNVSSKETGVIRVGDETFRTPTSKSRRFDECWHSFSFRESVTNSVRRDWEHDRGHAGIFVVFHLSPPSSSRLDTIASEWKRKHHPHCGLPPFFPSPTGTTILLRHLQPGGWSSKTLS